MHPDQGQADRIRADQVSQSDYPPAAASVAKLAPLPGFKSRVLLKVCFQWFLIALLQSYNDSLSQVVFFPDSNNDAVNRRLPINTESKVRWINCMLRFLVAVYIFTLDSNTTLQMQNDDFTGQLACIFLNYYSLHMSSLTNITGLYRFRQVRMSVLESRPIVLFKGRCWNPQSRNADWVQLRNSYFSFIYNNYFYCTF